MKNKIIIFDLDGVLFDSTAIAIENIKYLYPDITDETHRELLMGNFHEELSKLKILKREETEEQREQRKAEYAIRKSEVKMHDGMWDLLKFLHDSGYIININTSATNHNTLPLLEKSNTICFFDFLGTSDVSKSKVEKFKLMEEKYNMSAKDFLFVTDTLGDIREADIAGVPTVAVTWGAHDKNHFTREPHKNLIAIIDSADNLKSFIENLYA